MPFTSPTFLFVFLPGFLAAYWLARVRWARNGLLLGASLLLYAWGEGRYVLLLLLSILANYLLGLWLRRARRGGSTGLPFAIGVGVNLLPLVLLKYASLLGAVGVPMRTIAAWRLPAGISFFTFMALSYLIATYRGEVDAERNPVRLGCYIALFPLTMAGPICRYLDLAPQLTGRRESAAAFAEGARRFVLGLGKKVLIADTLAIPANLAFGFGVDRLAPGLAWFGLVCYTLQIFFDFSGYTDMAIGIGRMLGFRFMENFDAPYAARSLRAFWSRWHISLSTWFRDYVFLAIAYPAGRAAERLRLTPRRADFCAYGAASIATMLLIGLWHGGTWGFIAWGAYHGVVLVLERTRAGRVFAGAPAPLQHAYLLVVVMVGWVLFRATTVAHTLGFLGALAGRSGGDPAPIARLAQADVLLALAAAVVLSTRAGSAVRRAVDRWVSSKPAPVAVRIESAFGVAECACLAVLLVVSLSALSAGTFAPFLYFRF